MKKAVYALLLATAVYGAGEIPAANAATAKTVSLQLTINSPGAGGSQFVLQGLRTPTDPVYSCSKTAAAAGDGTSSVRFAVVDLSGVNKTTITVSGTQVGTLAVTDAKYVDQLGNAITGGVTVKRVR
ncbi:hypothetical protein [Geobacter sp. AOG2]|uniref:hypothetical protein n=1 Tax=Geobacter sp. AOG2 TaxID=1566347 RepID=UPI001CC81A04|nr:hypothetical protein [Geobacter sp. AOG2]GFE60573.1 hypothetical protein AOG2_11610 [Geobacter sp. AOG2]